MDEKIVPINREGRDVVKRNELDTKMREEEFPSSILQTINQSKEDHEMTRIKTHPFSKASTVSQRYSQRKALAEGVM